jgi:hypothetical protein
MDYKGRLDLAKKTILNTDGPGEAGTRLFWCLKQVGHSYTNMDVENLRVLFPNVMLKESPFGGKDWGYIIGHITQLFIVPTIIIQIATLRKTMKDTRMRDWTDDDDESWVEISSLFAEMIRKSNKDPRK